MSRVGITGHQRLDNSDTWPWVETAIRNELTKLPPPLTGITSLAIGADQLLARVVLDLGGRIHAVLPFLDIERSFSPVDVMRYRELVERATVEVLEVNGADEDAYLAAGQRVVDLSDCMIALWDRKPAKGKGGTGDIVAYALHKGVPVIHIDPTSRAVRNL